MGALGADSILECDKNHEFQQWDHELAIRSRVAAEQTHEDGR